MPRTTDRRVAEVGRQRSGVVRAGPSGAFAGCAIEFIRNDAHLLHHPLTRPIVMENFGSLPRTILTLCLGGTVENNREGERSGVGVVPSFGFLEGGRNLAKWNAWKG